MTRCAWLSSVRSPRAQVLRQRAEKSLAASATSGSSRCGLVGRSANAKVGDLVAVAYQGGSSNAWNVNFNNGNSNNNDVTNNNRVRCVR